MLNLFHSDAAFRTSQAMHFHDHCRSINAPRQVANFALSDIVYLVQPAPAPTTLKPPGGEACGAPTVSASSPVRPTRLDTLGTRAKPKSPSILCAPTAEFSQNLSSLNRRWLAGLHEFLRRATFFSSGPAGLSPLAVISPEPVGGTQSLYRPRQSAAGADSDDVNGPFRRDVNKVGA